MTIAVFNKGEFVDFWLNEPSDKTWVDRTISAKGWLQQDVEVYLYEKVRSSNDLLAFDENKNLQVLQAEVVEVDGVQQTVYSVLQTYNKIPYYISGNVVYSN